MNFLMVFIRTIFFYFFIFIIYRIMGKRKVGQLGIIDLIVSILIAELAIISIEDYNKDIMYSIIPILTLLMIQVVLSILSLKLPKFRIFLDGNPSVIIKDGRLNYREMTKQKYNLDDLMTQLRSQGYRSIEEIEYAILENNGNLSIFSYHKDKKKSPFPMPVILDSKIQKDTLKQIGKDTEWVKYLLDKNKIDIEDVFYAFYKDKNLFIIKNSDLMG